MLSSSRIPGVAIANAWNSRLADRAWPSAPALIAQVLLHRVLRVDRDREQARRELDLLEQRAVLLERPLDPLLGGELGDDRAQAAAGGEQPERDRDRRLADAALAGDEDQALVKQAGQRADDTDAPGSRERHREAPDTAI